MSYVVGVLQIIIYLVVLAVDSLSTAALQRRLLFIGLNSVPCLTVQTKGLREFKQGLVSHSEEWYERTVNY